MSHVLQLHQADRGFNLIKRVHFMHALIDKVSNTNQVRLKHCLASCHMVPALLLKSQTDETIAYQE